MSGAARARIVLVVYMLCMACPAASRSGAVLTLAACALYTASQTLNFALDLCCVGE